MPSSDVRTPETGPPGPVLEFSENRLMIDLCGPFDQHLAAIEKALDVQIVRRGNFLTLLGEPPLTERAAQVLQSLYARLEGGRGVEPADIDMILRMGDSAEDTGVRAGDQIEMPISGGIEIQTRKKRVEPRTEAQKAYVQSLFENEMAFGIGPAGTGKTYLAVAQGVALLQSGRVDRIVLSRPAVEAGERLGFLPGDMKEKVDPYLRPLYDALHDMLPAEQVARRIAAGEIEIAPLAFMRGRTLAHCYAILDEAQNTTPAQMKMFLTRMGEGSRMVITGDPTQIDLPPNQPSGLVEALGIVAGVEGIGVTRFSEQDVVRHPLVARIVAAYGRADDQNRAKKEKNGTGK